MTQCLSKYLQYMHHLLFYFLSLFINLSVPLLVGKIHVNFTTVTFALFPQYEIWTLLW